MHHAKHPSQAVGEAGERPQAAPPQGWKTTSQVKGGNRSRTGLHSTLGVRMKICRRQVLLRSFQAKLSSRAQTACTPSSALTLVHMVQAGDSMWSWSSPHPGHGTLLCSPLVFISKCCQGGLFRTEGLLSQGALLIPPKVFHILYTLSTCRRGPGVHQDRQPNELEMVLFPRNLLLDTHTHSDMNLSPQPCQWGPCGLTFTALLQPSHPSMCQEKQVSPWKGPTLDVVGQHFRAGWSPGCHTHQIGAWHVPAKIHIPVTLRLEGGRCWAEASFQAGCW